ncbi:MAG: hypothetical protein SFW65_04860 [Alphaproteobacteria bacterium]|nr:hypothetical protein [Alphaproteobacteria bacterium]
MRHIHHSNRLHSSPKRLVTLIGLWGLVIASIGGFATVAILASNRTADTFALCQSSPLKAVSTTLVVVDTTDTFTQDQQLRLRLTIEAERDRVPEGGRFVVLSLNPEAAWQPVELVSVCNPGKGENANPLLVTRSKVEKRWHAVYGEPIDKAVINALDQAPSERSPIIQTLAATLTRADFDTRTAARRLVIISDLLEHEKGGYSQLRPGDFWSSYQASALPKTARLHLQGVSVSIDYLQRGKFAAVQGPRHQAFWERLLKEAGASEVTFLGMASPVPSVQAQNGRR